jgi:hypothetical protein
MTISDVRTESFVRISSRFASTHRELTLGKRQTKEGRECGEDDQVDPEPREDPEECPYTGRWPGSR